MEVTVYAVPFTIFTVIVILQKYLPVPTNIVVKHCYQNQSVHILIKKTTKVKTRERIQYIVPISFLNSFHI